MHRYSAHPVPDQCLPVHDQLQATNSIQEFQCNERSSSFANASERTSQMHRQRTESVGLDDALTAPERQQQPLAKALFRQSRTATVLVGDPK
jgi:hypothetical protein